MLLSYHDRRIAGSVVFSLALVSRHEALIFLPIQVKYRVCELPKAMQGSLVGAAWQAVSGIPDALD